MQIRAAVLEEFGAPLEVQDLELERAAAGRGAGAAGGLRRVSHRPLHGLRRRPLRVRADGARPRGGRRGRARGGGYAAGRARRSRRDALLAPVRRVHSLPQPEDQSLPGDPRAAEQGLSPRRHDAAVPRRRADPPLHGDVDLRRVHGDAGDRAREGLAGSAARPRLPVRLRPLDRPRRGDVHGRRWSRAPPASCSAPAWWASGAVAGCRLQGAERIVCVDMSAGAAASWRRGRGRPTCCPAARMRSTGSSR